ncbi:VacJ family lipoprotein [Ferrigenium sp. UT5]|uniref:MlaA family lipoprotein n=1 Tax=Ferrigenium sp. UT5 TaxID=3242105 RepID=UPI00354D33A6
MLGACGTAAHKSDPFESFNRKVYAFNDVVDRAVIKPVARGYNKVMPAPGKTMVNNFFSNLDDILITFNDLLQFKFRQAISDGSRVAFNTTFGLFGLFEITTRLEKHNEDFGQTLRYWGFPSGPYLMLPILGPSTLTDTVGLYTDNLVSVTGRVNDDTTRYLLYAGYGINLRARLLESEKVLDSAAIDRYSFLRDAYLMRRVSLAYDGNPPRPNYEEFDEAE